MCVTASMWRPEDNSWVLVLSFHCGVQSLDWSHQVCMVSTFTHGATSLALMFIYIHLIFWSTGIEDAIIGSQ